MDKIKELRSELAKKKRLAEESYRKAKATLGVQPVRSVQPLTKVEQFSFATDKRVKDNRNEANQPSPKEFTAMLRKAVEPAVCIPEKCSSCSKYDFAHELCLCLGFCYGEGRHQPRIRFTYFVCHGSTTRKISG